MVRIRDDNLRLGASVWHVDHGNGVIKFIDWADNVIDVEFDKNNQRSLKTFEIDDVFACWDDQLQQWVIPV